VGHRTGADRLLGDVFLDLADLLAAEHEDVAGDLREHARDRRENIEQFGEAIPRGESGRPWHIEIEFLGEVLLNLWTLFAERGERPDRAEELEGEEALAEFR